MKTAIEPPIPAWTTDELTHRLEHGYPSVERLAAAAMLRTQAAEIESLKVEYVKELDKVSERNYSLRKENEALKADAERYKWLRKNAVFGYCSAEGCNNDDVYLTVTGYTTFPKSGETVDIALDAAIDAMRKS